MMSRKRKEEHARGPSMKIIKTDPGSRISQRQASLWASLLEPLNIAFRSASDHFQSLHKIVMDYALSICQGRWLSVFGDSQTSIEIFGRSKEELYVFLAEKIVQIFDSEGKLLRTELAPEFTIMFTNDESYFGVYCGIGHIKYIVASPPKFDKKQFVICKKQDGFNSVVVDSVSNRVFISYSLTTYTYMNQFLTGRIVEYDLLKEDCIIRTISDSILQRPQGLCIHRSQTQSPGTYLCVCDSQGIVVFNTDSGRKMLYIETVNNTSKQCAQNHRPEIYCRSCLPNHPRQILSVGDQLLIAHNASNTIQIYNFDDGSYEGQFELPVPRDIDVINMVLLNNIVFIRDSDNMIHRFI
jgi:hypothetical protein